MLCPRKRKTARQATSSRHLLRESPFAAAEDKLSDPPVKSKSKQVRRVAKRARKVENRQERLQAARELFADQEAEAHIANQGVIDTAAEIKEIGTTTHDE